MFAYVFNWTYQNSLDLISGLVKFPCVWYNSSEVSPDSQNGIRTNVREYHYRHDHEICNLE